MQVHGCKGLICGGAGRMHPEQADILLSGDGSPVAVRVADCAPVLLADPTSGIVAAVHAGWRGTAAGIVMHAVQDMLAAGASNVTDIIACIGPCIGPCCFRIGEETAEALRQSCPDAAAFVQSRNGQIFADLAAINRAQLVRAGIGQANIEQLVDGAAACTCCNTGHFFSYRRDGHASGRHLAIVASMRSA
jgi:purine-nucleoside/S-methyl-5'-thioadenosine phosphorylase / adenosine deaminase